MDTAAQGRLMAFCFLRCLNCHVGNIICAIPAVLCGAADGQIFKVGIACEEVRCVCVQAHSLYFSHRHSTSSSAVS